MRTCFWTLLSRVRGTFLSTRLDDDFDREVGEHLALLTADNIRRGMTPDDARRAALMRFGGPMQIKEQQHDDRGLHFIETTLQDVRYALRSIVKYRAFSIVAIATLAIGIGAATSMFTVVRAVLLRPLPFAEPDRLVEISETNPLKGWTHTVSAPANFADWRARNSVFTDIAGYNGVDDRGASLFQRVLTVNDEPSQVNGVATTGNLFDVLGVRPLLGRTFTWDETFDGKDRVLVLAYGTWRNLLGGDPNIIGRDVLLSGRSMTVIGVMPRDFFFPNRSAQFWSPMGVQLDLFVKTRRPHFMNTVARLKRGVSLAQARDQMTRIASDLEHEYADTNTKMGVRLEPLHDIMVTDARPTILMLFGAVAVLFLIVCANIASLQLGRGASRMREIAVRRALGAGRARLVRQLLTESLVLSILGALLGVALATLTPSVLLRAAPSALPLFATPQIDVPVLLFAAALAIAAPIVFGLVPAMSSSRFDRLAERTESGSRQTTRARDVLVAFEVALSVILVVGSMLLIRSLLRLQQVDPGFSPEHVVTFKVTLPRIKYPKSADQARVFTDIEERLRSTAGVQAVGAASALALRGYTYTSDATPEGRTGDDYERETRFNAVTPDYFKAIGVRLLFGRSLTERDTRGSKVIQVNEALARKYFGSSDVVGKRLKGGRPSDDDPWVTIVGVVADVKQDGLDKATRPEVYMPYAASVQNPATFAVRSTIDASSIASSARQTVRALDRDVLLTDVTTLDNLVRDSMGDERFRTTLLGAFAAVALFLAALGIYGVLSYFVSQRSRELGIRLTLGARRSTLFALVIGQGVRPVVAGAIVGLIGALALTSVMQSLLFGVQPMDPPTYAIALALLGTIAVTACAVPALRATRVDPLVALRDE
ncbi:MAG: ABC transporter permease [Acidobacteria bacterium]|nr:ABC transporter permease [Acidobacteriota bacterium]